MASKVLHLIFYFIILPCNQRLRHHHRIQLRCRPVQHLHQHQLPDSVQPDRLPAVSAHTFLRKVSEQTQQAGGQAGPNPGAGAGAAQGGNESGYGDDVVDADYKEV